MILMAARCASARGSDVPRKTAELVRHPDRLFAFNILALSGISVLRHDSKYFDLLVLSGGFHRNRDAVF